MFRFSYCKFKPTGEEVYYYLPTEPLYIRSINIKTKEVSFKEIKYFTVHKNVKLYKIYSREGRFKTLYGTTDHGYIVASKDNFELKRVSLKEIDKNKHYFIKYNQENNNLEYIDLSDLVIEESNKDTAFDFVIPDNETFSLDDGLFVYDTMAVYRVIDKEHNKMIWEKMSIESKSASINFQDLSYQLVPKQDIIYSLYKLSLSDEGKENLKQVIGDCNFNNLNKKELEKILMKTNEEKVLSNLCKIADFYTSCFPITLSILDFIKTKNGQPFPVPNLKGNYEEDRNELENITNFIEENFNKRDIIKSGSRGSFGQVRQIIASRGYVTNFKGEIIEVPIKGNYLNGLDNKELMNSARGTRKALMDSASTISQSGYLYRKLAFCSSNAILIDEDCGTKETIKLQISEMLAPALRNRYLYLENPKIKEDAELLYYDGSNYDIVNKEIYLRSPLRCKSLHGYCKKCYGNLEHNSRFIGLIAAQSISERTSQLTLRTFHTGGAAKAKKKDGEDIVNTLKYIISYYDSIRVYKSIDELVKELLDIWYNFAMQHNILMVHFETIATERSYVKYNDDKEILLKFLRDEDTNNIKEILSLSVRKVPLRKSRTLGLLFESPAFGLCELIKDRYIKYNKKVNYSVLDKIYLYLYNL